MNKAFPFLALLAFLLAGCNPSASKGGAVAPDPRLPVALRNDAYEYYGLGNTKPMRLELVSGEGATPTYGTRTFKMKSVEGDKAIFVQHQDAALENEGDITLSLEKDGLFVVSSTKGTLKRSMEIPAKLDVGSGWTDHTEMDQGGQKIDLQNELKIERKERVATPGGTFDDALYVTSTGKGTLGGAPVTLVTKHWYVRGLGPVKEVVEVRSATGPSRTITIQLAGKERPGEAQPATPTTPPEMGSLPPTMPTGESGPAPTAPTGTGK